MSVSVIIATPDKEIQKVSSSFGADTMITEGNHLRGTERVYEVYEKLNKEYEIVVNFQGDEPLVSSEYLDITIETLA